MSKVTLNWKTARNGDEITYRNMDEFFKENNTTKTGLYFWIFKGKEDRIAYIGETRDFKGRFLGHFDTICRGLYSAFNVKSDVDLLDEYKKSMEAARRKKDDWSESKKNEAREGFYFPTSINSFGVVKSDRLIDEYITTIKKNIDIRVEFWKNMKFEFAEIASDNKKLSETDNKKLSDIRKAVEAFFMLRTNDVYSEPGRREDAGLKYEVYHPSYVGSKKSLNGISGRCNSFFWGSITKYPENSEYEVNNEGEWNKSIVLQELGLKKDCFKFEYEGK